MIKEGKTDKQSRLRLTEVTCFVAAVFYAVYLLRKKLKTAVKIDAVLER